MIIKFIPETDQEKDSFAKNNVDEIVHENVKEYMVFGNKIDEEGDSLDFHEWKGSYRYLLGSLEYFSKIIDDARKENEINKFKRSNFRNFGLIKHGEIDAKIETIDTDSVEKEGLRIATEE
jgi:hypothetical protein